MNYLVDKLREILGVPDFYIEGSGYSSSWDYGAMIEYIIASCILIIVITFTFKCLIRLIDKI